MSSVFKTQQIKILTKEDFELSGGFQLTLKDKTCALVLFHGVDPKSIAMANLFTEISTKVPGPIFMVCDVMMQTDIRDAMIRISQDFNHPLNHIGLSQIPLILDYRGGYPQERYMGEIQESALIAHATNSVCSLPPSVPRNGGPGKSENVVADVKTTEKTPSSHTSKSHSEEGDKRNHKHGNKTHEEHHHHHHHHDK